MFFSMLTWFLACGEKSEDTANPEDIGCTLEFRYSSTISVVDKEGAPLESEFLSVTYTVDGVEGEYVESWEAGSVIVGGEEAGDFVVNLAADVPDENDACCSDVGTATLEFTIEADECHVIPQNFDANLEWGMVCADSEDCG